MATAKKTVKKPVTKKPVKKVKKSNRLKPSAMGAFKRISQWT